MPTLIRIFDNAIFNAYPPSYVCTLYVKSTDPEGDNIAYEIQWDPDPNFSSPSSDTVEPYADDSIGVQIEYKSGVVWNLIPDSDLPGNSIGFFDNTSDFCTVDLSALNTNIYDTLRIKSNFRKPIGKASLNPAFKMWGVGNTNDNITGIHENENPLTFAIKRIEPNPFTNRTEISYQLRKRAKISIRVFDLIGRIVITFENVIKEPGKYNFI